MSSSTPIADILASLEGSFRRQGVRWYLFGAQAVVLWGRPRTSVDIDVTVHLALERVPELIRSLADSGFELRIQSDVDEFVARTRVFHSFTRAREHPWMSYWPVRGWKSSFSIAP